MSSFLKRLRGKGAPVGDEAKKGEEKAGERPGGAAPPPQHHHNHPRQHTPTPRRPHRGGGKEGEEEEEDEEDGEGEADIEDEDEPEEGGGDDYDDGEDFAEEDANTFGDAEEDRAEENISYYDDDEGDEEEEEEEEEEDEEELVLSPEEDEYSGEDYSGESGEDGEGEYSGDDGYDDEEGLDEDEEVARAEAQPFDILNAIACALYEPDESDSDDEGNSVSDVDPAQNDDEGAEHTAFSAEELKKIRLVFAHCDTMNLRHLNEDQFGIALALLGQTESMDQLKKLYDHEARADGLDDAGFEKCLAKLRTKAKGDDQMARIREAFDALYRGTCPQDDQKDFGGNRYIFAKDLRLLVRTTGDESERLTDEEADELIRECRPIFPKKVDPRTGEELEEEDGIAVASLNGKIFFEQYRSMLLDINP